jgi:hypothetical protein
MVAAKSGALFGATSEPWRRSGAVVVWRVSEVETARLRAEPKQIFGRINNYFLRARP